MSVCDSEHIVCIERKERHKNKSVQMNQGAERNQSQHKTSTEQIASSLKQQQQRRAMSTSEEYI